MTACGGASDETPTGSNAAIRQAIAEFGCESGAYQITGCWLSQQCDEAIFNGQSLGRWVNKIYSFNADGTTQSVELQYGDAHCAGTPNLGVISPFPDTLTYSEFGSVNTGDGLNGYGLVLSDSLLGSPVQAIYHITHDNELCFTSNIVLGSLNNTFAQLGSDTSIDFDNCLLAVNQPR